ncbi:MAG: SDR family NAD(P)-dependent oxidoreductase [Egibacteraceae bacterium]
MVAQFHRRELVIGVSPFGEPNARLVGAVCCADGLGVLDLGVGDRQTRQALDLTRRWAPGPFGVRVTAGCALRPADLPAEVDVVLLGADAPWQPAELVERYRVLAEVTGVEEALRAAGEGAHGLVARGHEAGGRVGALSSFVLLQRLLSTQELDLPVWVCGGVGLRTAAGAVLGGAAGVVLDSQLALLTESELPEEVSRAIAAMDGSETVLLAGHRVLRRRGPEVRPGPDAAQTDSVQTAEEVAARLGARDLRTQALPIGQDGFLAKRFADRFSTAGRAVRAVRESILDALREGSAGDTLRAGTPLSRALGTTLPIAQGPMTRVSDQARFAAAVAEEGAMPFIALALSGREQTRTLLDQTRAALGDHPWGVGVLGFAPEEIRAAQLEVIREVRPSCAVIASGRPSQAAALEAVGIGTFLHVPSPGLLEQFLDAGARKFVFEGSECGGHVGPRSSFSLWEAQLAVLGDYLDAQRSEAAASQIQVLFAGGVHDARSAAMVAVLAAPLARRGAGVGVLMGTAYLFTEEAVACGAIQPLFQRQVLRAERTELLETAPGHATRCVASPFAERFLAVKDDLRARGLPDRQVWEELELLNVGRLRVASKGVQRLGADLVAVDEAEQLAQGLFMAGQVAVLRSATTTIPALHSAVSGEAADLLAARTAQLRSQLEVADVRVRKPATAPPLDIAVVGMACVFPGSPDLASFWANVVAGTDAITEVPAERWDTDVYYSPEATGDASGDRTPSKWGGFLPKIPFDPLRYGIPPSSLASIEPVQLLALEVARRALADAGYEHRDLDRSRVAVVFGAQAGSDLSATTALRSLLPAYLGEIPQELAAQLPRLTEDSFPGMLANVIAGRIANRLDLGGGSYTVDAACASSLAALDAACKELVTRASDLVLCGGADLHNGVNDYLLFSSVHALSPTGRCRTFDSAADGITLGEGVACVALKRLADAERDGDRIYAVIKGLGSASDGKSLGLTAPRPQGQRNALERAYHNARIFPSEVGLVEAHGSGTVVGDRTELRTLTALFVEAGAAPGSCALGSVKSQIGHTKCAAGLAGLIKAALALHCGIRPPTLHVAEPNPAWHAESSPFCFSGAARPWAAPPAERVAGVSAFGFGGTNFHVVLRAYDGAPAPRHGIDEWPVELLTFPGADHLAACRSIEQLLELARTNDAHGRPWRLRDLARTVSRQSDQSDEPVQVAIVATDLDDLAGLLRRAAHGEHDPASGLFLASGSGQGGQAGQAGAVAMLFPGQGSQRPGMLAELFVAFPEVGHFLQLGRRWADTLFPPAAFDPDAAGEQETRLRDTRVAQPALGITGLAVHELLTRLGVRPDLLAGHSYGELVALCAAGAFDPATLLKLSEARAEAILAAAGVDPGAMAAVSASVGQAERVLRAAGLAEQVVVANHNGPRQVVISGPTALVERATAQFSGSKRLSVACAFHSPVVAGARTRFADALSGRPLRDLEVPVWSNRTAASYPKEADGVRTELAAQVDARVRFVEQIESMYAHGARVFVEAGPGDVLTGLVGAILGDRPHVAVACEGPAGQGLRGFLAALAQLAVAGVRLRTGWLLSGRDATDVSDTTTPSLPGWTVDGHAVRTVDGAFLPDGLAPPRRVPVTWPSDGVGRAGPDADPEALITEFLRASVQVVTAQRDVLLSYFGAAPGVPWRQQLTAQPAAQQPQLGATAVPAAAPQATGPSEWSAADTLATVLEIISERTGYPIDMIEPDVDLEADLSVDSIKRTEIAGELATRLAAATDAGRLTDAELEELVKARTAAAISGWLTARMESAAPAVGAQSDEPPHRTTAVAPNGVAPECTHPEIRWHSDASASPNRLQTLRVCALDAPCDRRRCWTPSMQTVFPSGSAKRLVLERRPLDRAEAADSSAFADSRFVIFGGGSVGAELATQLRGHGAFVSTAEEDCALTWWDGHPHSPSAPTAPTAPADGVIYLHSLVAADEPLLPEAFPTFQAALARRPRWLLAACPVDVSTGNPPLGHVQAAGLRGLFRTVAMEYPDTHAALVEVDPTAAPAATARLLVGELLAGGHAPVVTHVDGSRHALTLVETALDSLGGVGAGLALPPGGDGAAEAAAIGLDRDSVVLLVGGARGITAHVAAGVASVGGCRIELVGRTPLPTEPEHPRIAAAVDRLALRTAMVALGHRSPAEVERTVSRILAQREVAATLAELRGLGSPVRYHCVDARDHDAVHRLVKEIHTEHGRIDGVVYAAGVIEDRLLAEKDMASFRRVFTTKVDGARALLDAVENLPSGPRFVVLFGSVAAVLGNRGQADYAAANDALESLGVSWSARTGHRALTVHWGPWMPSDKHGGMVTPELAREYRRRGIALIDPQEGTRCLLRELAWGEESVRAVVYTASGLGPR